MKFSLKPKLRFSDIEFLLDRKSLNPLNIENHQAYELLKRLTNLAPATSKTKSDQRWDNFYLPLKRKGKFTSLPFSVVKYQRKYYCHFFSLSCLCVKNQRQETDEMLLEMFREAIRFFPEVRKMKGEIIKKTVPYDFRTGKIKGKYVLQNFMSEKEGSSIRKLYKNHLEKQDSITGCSLNEYLDTACLCYKSAFGVKAKRLTPRKMYQKWADGRHGGMLDIEDRNSQKAFRNWYRSKRWQGAHPFEIVFSWHCHGIHLYPPSDQKKNYLLALTNYAYINHFLKMVKGLIKNSVPLIVQDFDNIIDFLMGETYFTVNEYTGHSFFYTPCREDKAKYFKHILWDELKIV